MPFSDSYLLLGLLTVIFLPILFVPVILLGAKKMGQHIGWLAMVPALVSMILLGWLLSKVGLQPGVVVGVDWVPSLGVNLSFLFDGLSVFYGLIISGIGALVSWYGAEYLGHQKESIGRFYAYLLFFMTAMLGTVFSNNLLLLFVFWELTGIASFLLIGFFYECPDSRRGARQALIVTVGTGLCLLAGVIFIGLIAGTYSLVEILDQGLSLDGSRRGWVEAACILVLIGAFGKSAQFPFHFWLPGAMSAPTPVSAYLHSATMVKLGVFLTARLLPAFQSLELWFWMVCGVGFFTMLLGAFLAFRSNDFKAILAYSTVSQLGLLIGAYGLSSRSGVQVDFVHILSHVFYKGSLFMTAGIVDHCTGTRNLRQLGGLAKRMPITAFSAAVGVAALAGLPLTTGFISKELLLTDLVGMTAWYPISTWIFLTGVVLSATLIMAIAIRIFFNVFLGSQPENLKVERAGWSIQIPPLLLAICALIFGIFPFLLDGMVNGLKVAGLHDSAVVHLALWHGWNFELWITVGIVVAGAVLYLQAQRSQWQDAIIPKWLRFDEGFEKGLDSLTQGAKRLTHILQADWPPAYLPIVIAFLLIAFMSAIAISPERFFEGITKTEWHFAPLKSLIVIAITVSLLGVVLLRRWTTQVIALSVAGFFITFYFVLYRAPDLAMTQILVETASIVMILLLLSRFPASQIQSPLETTSKSGLAFRIVLSLGVGLVMSLLVIFSDLHRHANPIGPKILDLAQSHAKGANAVNVILVDFRAFDTMGEITVLLIATLAGLGLMMRYKRGRSDKDVAPPPGFFLGEKEKK